MSKDTDLLFESLNADCDRDIHLYSRKIDVAMNNSDKLRSLKGPVKVYHSEEGQHISPKMRKSIDVPQRLFLKIGAPVILSVNISSRLVNGLTGVVKDLKDDFVIVHFQDVKETHNIAPHNFFQFNHMTNTLQFVVRQIPLILGYAITIHKSQGMTLPSVLIDCQGAFAPGQISVGLSRVRDPAHLTVHNFRPGLCPPHHPDVNKFCREQSRP